MQRSQWEDTEIGRDVHADCARTLSFSRVNNKSKHRKEVLLATLNFTKLKELLRRLEGDKVSFKQRQSKPANFLYCIDETSSTESNSSDSRP